MTIATTAKPGSAWDTWRELARQLSEWTTAPALDAVKGDGQ